MVESETFFYSVVYGVKLLPRYDKEAMLLRSAFELLILFAVIEEGSAVLPTYIGNGLNLIVERNDLI